MNSLLTISELSNKQIMSIIKRAIQFKESKNYEKINDSVCFLFVENSTRTLLSFQKAATNLGIERFILNADSSSLNKGETLEDTLLNLKTIGIDKFVIRSSKDFYWKGFPEKFKIINGGDGISNHPTQALLDAMTIYEHFGTLEKLKVLFVGDTKHSRVFRSNKELLKKFNSKIFAIGPKTLANDNSKLIDVIDEYDVVNMLRVQHERHHEKFSTDTYFSNWGLGNNCAEKMKENSIFMHPGPVNRNIEIAEGLLYKHPKNKILNQVENGVYIRMAILEEICKNS